MSLTSHIRDPSSPIHAWFSTNLPETRRFATAANRLIRSGRSTCEVARLDGADASLVGDAVEYLLAAYLWPQAFNDTLAAAGASTMEMAARHIGLKMNLTDPYRRAHQRLLDPIRGLAATEVVDDEVCEDCLLLAALGFVGRFGARTDDAARFAEPLWNEASIADLRALGRAAVADHADLRHRRPVYVKPEFAATRLLGGADADVVIDGLLLDFKSNAPAGVVGRDELWQLAGYLLADLDDRYAVREVGISALRWRQRIVWPAVQFLAALAGHPESVPVWRGQFAEMLAAAAARRGRRSSGFAGS